MCVEIHPTIAVSEFVRIIKQESSKWLKEERNKFPLFDGWGNGYAGFTYSAADRPNVICYIKNQKEHHRKVGFREEFESLLMEFGLDPNEDRLLDD